MVIIKTLSWPRIHCGAVYPDTPGMNIKQTQPEANRQPPAGGREKNIFNIKTTPKEICHSS